MNFVGVYVCVSMYRPEGGSYMSWIFVPCRTSTSLRSNDGESIPVSISITVSNPVSVPVPALFGCCISDAW